MIRDYILHNFKNHADTHLILSNLTLLTGTNSAGKSSVIQSLLMLREAFLRNPNMNMLYLKGEAFNVGRSNEIVNVNCPVDQDKLVISMELDNGMCCRWVYRYPLTADSSLKIEAGEGLDEQEMRQMGLFSEKFQYLSAFRDGPQTIYESDTDLVDSFQQVSGRMGRGEFGVYFLSKFGEMELPIDELCLIKEKPHTLRQQTECWLGEISAGVQMQINQNNTQYELKFGYQKSGEKNIFFSAQNTGFGLTYILSVIVAILSAKPGALVMIENPEAHIHPAGQAALMRLIARAAAHGVQLVIETHSDHVVNAALVDHKHGVLQCEQISVYYFERDDHFNATPVKLEIGENGRLHHAPRGFFDQMSADLEVLFDL